MGRVVTFTNLRPSKIISGTHTAAITQGETQEMAAEYIRIPPGQQWIATAPPETDCYLFIVDGACAISAADNRHRFSTQTFAVVQEGIEFTVENDSSAPASIIKVVAPRRRMAGARLALRANSRSLDALRHRLLICRRRKRLEFIL